MYERDELELSFADGGDSAVRSAYDRYGSLVYTFCRRTVGHHDATEVAQDVFVAAWRSQNSYDHTRGGLGGWLIAIARNKAIDQIRRRAQRIPSELPSKRSMVPPESGTCRRICPRISPAG
jgi:RNA polymerase sigma-70 factor (ECF subfamily)